MIEKFTTAKRQEGLRSTKDIGTSVRSKNGGNENPRTSGKLKGESVNMDYALGAAAAFGGPYSGNKYGGVKDAMQVIKDVVAGFQAGSTGAEVMKNQLRSLSPLLKTCTFQVQKTIQLQKQSLE